MKRLGCRSKYTNGLEGVGREWIVSLGISGASTSVVAPRQVTLNSERFSETEFKNQTHFGSKPVRINNDLAQKNC